MKDGYDVFRRDGAFHLRAWGGTENELCARALLGLAAIMRPDVVPGGRDTVYARVHVRGQYFSDAFEKFLKAVMFENEMYNAVFSAMHSIHISPDEIEVELVGKKIDHKEEELSEIELLTMDRDHGKWEIESRVLLI